MRWAALALLLIGLAGMFLPVVGVDFGEAAAWSPPIGVFLATAGGLLFARALRRAGMGISDPRAWKRFRSNRGAVAGGLLVALVIVTSFVGPIFAPYDPDAIHENGLQPIVNTPVEPNGVFPLGTDHLGRDELSRMLYGGRVSLAVAFGAVLIAGTLGFIAGLFAGYFGRALDMAVVQLVNFVLSLPFLLVAIVVNRVIEDPALFTLCLLLGGLSWTTLARVTRAKTMQVRELEYVQAARALGVTHVGIIVRHIVPNVIGPALVIVTTLVSQMIVVESAMSFLGLGVKAPTASWGSMLHDSQDWMELAPRLMLFPAILIVATVFGFNLLGEGLRDALDPKE
jgi:peptide/nickel transport system permease protein